MIKKYRVKSESDPNKAYIVHHYKEKNKFVCMIEGGITLCPSYVFSGRGFHCKHIKKVRKYLKENKK